MATGDYEIIPLKEVKNLKDEINKLKKEKAGSHEYIIATSLDRMSTSLERLFEIFHVAATEIEQGGIQEKSFEEKIQPIMDRLKDIEEQNKDIAEGILALADIVKKQVAVKPIPQPVSVSKPVTPVYPGLNPSPFSSPEGPLPPMNDEMPPPPPPLK